MRKRLRHICRRIKDGYLTEKLEQLFWIYGFAKSQLLMILVYTLLGLTGTIVSLISSLVSRDLVDIITGHNAGKLLTTFCAMIGITLGSTLVGQISSYISTKVNLRVDNHVKYVVFEDIMNTEWEALSRYHSGDLLTRWSGDASTISSGILTLVPNAIIFTFRFCAALWMVIRYDASFAVFALLGIPVSLLISKESMKRMREGNMGTLAISTKVSSFNQEAFSNVQILKAFDLLPLYAKKLRALQNEYTSVRLKYQKLAIVNSMFLTVVSMLVSYSAQGWGVYKVWSGDISYGTMTMFIGLSTTLSGTVNNLINLFPSAIALTNSAKRLMDISNMPKENYRQRDEVKKFYEEHSSEGVGICLRDISYAYPESDVIFEEAQIDAFPFEVVAFVGPSGEGKTTMMRYILSLIKPQKGCGYLCAGNSLPEDRECMELTASVRQLMAYVPQGNTMFSGTIAENMRNVKEDATDDEIIEALKLACAWKFVEKLPEGINSPIKERGGGFSEGQAQRLSIARALLRKSPILLLDEATSALDIATEREVLRNIMKDEYPRTCIVTTHRPTVLSICNRVYAIEDKKCRLLDNEEIERRIADF